MSDAPPPSSPTPGDVLDGRFVVEALAGQGGLGQVFRGWDLQREVMVAIKLLAAQAPPDARRFRREVALLAALRVPGVVGYVAHGETTAGAPYLVMDWLDGVTVAARMADDGLTAPEAVTLVHAACTPLAGLHAHGLVHRDLKPENMVLASADPASVVLIDLGLARAAVQAEPRLTATGVVLGTPGYIAPEIIRGEPVIDGRADVFALGCVLYELLTGYAPFAGDNLLAVRTKILLTAPPAVHALCPEAPPALSHVVEAMLAKDPARRPTTAIEVAAALAPFVALAPGPRRTWREALPPTVRGGPRPVPDGWRGVVLVGLGAPGEPPLAADALRADLAPLGGELERIDDVALVVHVGARTLADLAPRLVQIARAIRARNSHAHVVLGSGRGDVGALIDQVAVLLAQAARAAMFGAGAARPSAVLVDASTAGALRAAGIALEAGAAGDWHWLVVSS